MAARTLIWMADATVNDTEASSLWSLSSGGGSCTLARTAGVDRFADKTGCLSNGTGRKNFASVASTALVCVAGRISSGATTQWSVSFWGDTGATQHVTVMFDGSGHFQVRRGTTAGTVLATGTAVIASATWFQAQIEVTISDTVGTVKVRVNGSASEDVSFSGDTKNAGTNTTVDRVDFVSTTSANVFDDIAIFTGAGDWPGDVRIYACHPNGNGNTSQGTGSDGDSTNNYLLVDERPFNTSDYVAITTDGNTDLVTVGDLPAGVTAVQGVMTVSLAAKSDAGSKGTKIVRRVNGTNYVQSSSNSLSTTYQAFVQLDQTSPDTSVAWTASEVNALEIGFQAAAS